MRDCLLRVLIPLIAASCVGHSGFALAEDAVKPVEAKLLAKGDGYWVHVLPGMAISFPEVVNQSQAVLHTSTKTGKMQCLFAAGDSTVPGPPMGIDRIYHAKWRLSDAAVADDHLFLLTWRAGATVMVTSYPPPSPVFDKGQYDLTVFNISDGAKLASRKLTGDSLPAFRPSFTGEKDPLQIKGDKITVFNQEFQFDGRELRPAK